MSKTTSEIRSLSLLAHDFVIIVGICSQGAIRIQNLKVLHGLLQIRGTASLPPIRESAEEGIGILVTEQASNFTEFERRLQ